MKIGILVPDEKAGRLAVSVGKNMNVELYWGLLGSDRQTEIENAKELIYTHGVEAIISRNPSGYALESELDIPVHIMHLSRIDIIRAASKITAGKRIAFFCLPSDRDKYAFNLKELEEIPEHPIHFSYPPSEAGITTIKNAGCAQQNVDFSFETILICEALITSYSCLKQEAEGYGMEAELIYFDEFELRNAISIVIRMVKLRKQKQLDTQLMEMALNTTHDGFLILENGQVCLVNENLCQIAGIHREDILWQEEAYLRQYMPFFNLILGICKKEIINYGGRPYCVFRRALPTTDDEAPHMELIA